MSSIKAPQYRFPTPQGPVHPRVEKATAIAFGREEAPKSPSWLTLQPERTIADRPIADRRGRNHNVRRVLFAGAALVGVAAAGKALEGYATKATDSVASTGHVAPLTKAQLAKLPKVYVAQEGDNVWDIATAEGPQVADTSATMDAAERQIVAQIPGRSPGDLQPGDPIRLPADSKIGTEIKK